MFIEFEGSIYNTDLIKEVYKIDEVDNYQIMIRFKEEMSTSLIGFFTRNVDFNFNSKEKRNYEFNKLVEKLIPSIKEEQLNEDIDCAVHEFIAKNKKD